jgi:hypothetical protein
MLYPPVGGATGTPGAAYWDGAAIGGVLLSEAKPKGFDVPVVAHPLQQSDSRAKLKVRARNPCI